MTEKGFKFQEMKEISAADCTCWHNLFLVAGGHDGWRQLMDVIAVWLDDQFTMYPDIVAGASVLKRI